ncbi:MAG: Fic family protein [Deltaproteobacteria bacterium]|jgi:Fic family protein|nr:Fic family protein [Deltaproteobacteria bacterium]
MDLTGQLNEIDRNRDLLREKCRLTPQQITNFDNHFRITNTFTSNAIEGNRLTVMETKLVLEDGISVGGKRLNDLLETVSHGKAFDLMLEIARENTLDTISKNLLRIVSDLHSCFYGMIDNKRAGIYRDVVVFIGGASVVPPAPEKLDTAMEDFGATFGKLKETYHPVLLAAYAHLRFVQIHPFIDGNGRTSRLLMNLILVNQGYQIIDFGEQVRDRYFFTLETASNQNYRDNAFYDLVADLELTAQKDYMRINNIDYPGPVPQTPPSGPRNGPRMG